MVPRLPSVPRRQERHRRGPRGHRAKPSRRSVFHDLRPVTDESFWFRTTGPPRRCPDLRRHKQFPRSSPPALWCDSGRSRGLQPARRCLDQSISTPSGHCRRWEFLRVRPSEEFRSSKRKPTTGCAAAGGKSAVMFAPNPIIAARLVFSGGSCWRMRTRFICHQASISRRSRSIAAGRSPNSLSLGRSFRY